MKVLVINGPNLNLLGEREPNVYGSDSLTLINIDLELEAKNSGHEIEFTQSNSEGEIIDKLHAARTEYDGVILNAGAYTHYSYAILDAIKAVQKPFVEVHMSDIHQREPFRHTSVIAPACVAQVCGFGKQSYFLGLRMLLDL